jgi:hypothetical protein
MDRLDAKTSRHRGSFHARIVAATEPDAQFKTN